MYLRVPLYKYKLCSTYGYLRTSIRSVTLTGDLNKYKLYSTYRYLHTSIRSVTPTGDLNKYNLCSTYGYLRTSIRSVTPSEDLNKYKFAISTSMCISLLYEFMKNNDICYCISVTVICLL